MSRLELEGRNCITRPMSSFWGVLCDGVSLPTDRDLKPQAIQYVFFTHLYIMYCSSVTIYFYIKSWNLEGSIYKCVTARHQEKDGVWWGKAAPWAVPALVSHSLVLLILFACCRDEIVKKSPRCYWFSSGDNVLYESTATTVLWWF